MHAVCRQILEEVGVTAMKIVQSEWWAVGQIRNKLRVTMATQIINANGADIKHVIIMSPLPFGETYCFGLHVIIMSALPFGET